MRQPYRDVRVSVRLMAGVLVAAVTAILIEGMAWLVTIFDDEISRLPVISMMIQDELDLDTYEMPSPKGGYPPRLSTVASRPTRSKISSLNLTGIRLSNPNVVILYIGWNSIFLSPPPKYALEGLSSVVDDLITASSVTSLDTGGIRVNATRNKGNAEGPVQKFRI